MEASFVALYRSLGKPVSEQYDVAYRRVRWPCGCIAIGRSSERMLVTQCLRHCRTLLERTVGRN
jgi:hypothetical protein